MSNCESQASPDRRRMVATLAADCRTDLHRYLVTRLKSEELARDIVQDAFARLLALDVSVRIDNPRGYIFRIALNLAIDHQRRSQSSPTDSLTDMDEQALRSTAPTPEDNMRLSQLSSLVDTAIRELPARSQEIFYLRRFEGMSTCEIADRFGVSQRMVQKSFARIMEHFGQRLAAYRQA